MSVYEKLRTEVEAASIALLALHLHGLEEQQTTPTQPTDAAKSDSRKREKDASLTQHLLRRMPISIRHCVQLKPRPDA